MDKKQELENLTKELQEKINLFNTLEIQKQNIVLEIKYLQGKIDLLKELIDNSRDGKSEETNNNLGAEQ
jgi:hypothetical protein